MSKPKIGSEADGVHGMIDLYGNMDAYLLMKYCMHAMKNLCDIVTSLPLNIKYERRKR